jgi:hypothetical protein
VAMRARAAVPVAPPPPGLLPVRRLAAPHAPLLPAQAHPHPLGGPMRRRLQQRVARYLPRLGILERAKISRF